MKEGIDYFSFDVFMHEDDKIQMVIANHGPLGHYIILRLFCKIYSQGYAYHWTDRESRIFAHNIRCDHELICDVVKTAINECIFDQNVYTKHAYLTSRGIQTRYLCATLRRKEVVFREELLLINLTEHEHKNRLRKIIVKLTEDTENVCIFNKNVDTVHAETQKMSTVYDKESKVKESKESIYIDPVDRVIQNMNDICGTSYKHNQRTIKDLQKLLNDGYTSDDIVTVIRKKAAEWRGTEYEKYLRPQTLFGSKFESYLNQKIKKTSSKANFEQREIPEEEFEALNNTLVERQT